MGVSVKGYSPGAIGGVGGSGYISAGFDFMIRIQAGIRHMTYLLMTGIRLSG